MTAGPPWVGDQELRGHWTDGSRGDRWEHVRNSEYPQIPRDLRGNPRQTGSGVARAQMSRADDVANAMGLSAGLDRYDASERDLAFRNTKAVYDLAAQSLAMLGLFDPGCPWTVPRASGFRLLHRARAEGSPVLDVGQRKFLPGKVWLSGPGRMENPRGHPALGSVRAIPCP